MTLVLIGAGSRSLQRLPVDAYPDLSPPMVEIITQWPGHAAEEVERLITVPVELGMNGIPQMTTIRARSRSTGCPTSCSLSGSAPTTTSPASRCSTGWATSTCRAGSSPSVSPLSSPSGLIYRYVLQSSDRSPMELKTFEDWIVEPQYRSVPGVADDSGFGGGTMQYQVLLDPAKIAARRPVGARRSRAALAANNGNAGGGFYSQGGQFYYVRGDGAPEHAGGHRQRGAGRAQRHAGAGEGCRPRGRSASRRAWASSATRNRTTPSKASS